MIIMIFQRWHSATLCDVTTVQLSNETVHTHKKKKKKLIMNMCISPTFILTCRYVRPIMILHAFMIELVNPTKINFV